MKVSPIFFIFMFFASSVFADPEIISTSGSFSNGAAVSISVTSPGPKTSSGPMTWLGGAIGNIESGSGDFSASGWSQVSVSDINAQYSATRAHSGTKSILFAWEVGGVDWSQIMFDAGAETETWFFSAWIYLDNTSDCSSFQWKSWRLRSDTDYAHNNGTTLLNDWWTNGSTWYNSGNVQVYYNSGTYDTGIDATSDQMLFGQWQRVEGYYKMSSSPSTADGVTWLRRVGRAGDMLTSSSLTTHDADDPKWRYLRVGQAFANQTGCSEGHYYVYYDDIYIDNTLSRVEIGDNAVWSDCTEREIQPATAWADGTPGSITITVNQGGFPDGTAYLFVVDADGVASSGYEITFGETSSTAPRFSGMTFRGMGQ